MVLPDEENDFDFKERFGALKAEFEAQLKEEEEEEEEELNMRIMKNLAKIDVR